MMQAGFAMLCAGSIRAKNVKNIMLKNFWMRVEVHLDSGLLDMPLPTEVQMVPKASSGTPVSSSWA